MVRALSLIALLALAGCTAMQRNTSARSDHPCAAGEATYACQIERYQRAPG